MQMKHNKDWKDYNLYSSLSMQELVTNGEQDENQQSIDIEQLKKAIQYGEKYMSLVRTASHSVIFWGNSGTGKSSSIIALNGQPLFGYKKAGRSILTDNITDNQKKTLKIAASSGKQAIFIQQSINSGTEYPAYLPLKPRQGWDKILLYDTPGFGDNKGITQILINTYFIHRLFNLQEHIKMVFVINRNDIDQSQKGNRFKKVAKTLLQALKNFNEYEKCMAILITKVDKPAKLQQIIQQLKSNLRILKKQYQNHSEFQKFLNLIENNKISILMIYSPSVKDIATKLTPENVTNQYSNFIQQFYEVVTKKLSHAKVPRLQAPGMSKSQKQKCNQFGQQVKQVLIGKFHQLIDHIKEFIESLYKQITFNQNHQHNKDCVRKYSQIIKFMNQVKKIMSKSYKNKQQFNKNLKQLSMLLELYNFNCINIDGQKKCSLMLQIQNQLIAIDFLECINIQNNKIAYETVCKEVMQIFINRINQIQKVSEQERSLAQLFYSQYIEQQIKGQISRWPNQKVYKQWEQDMKTIPSMYLRLGKYNKEQNILGFIQQLIKIQQQANMQCSINIYPLKQLLQHQRQKNVKIINNQSQLVNKIIRIVSQQENQIQRLLYFKNWLKQQTNNLKKVIKLDASNPQFKCLLDQKTSLYQNVCNLTDKNNELMNKISQLQKIKSQLQTQGTNTKKSLQKKYEQLQKIYKQQIDNIQYKDKLHYQLQEKYNQLENTNKKTGKQITNQLIQLKQQRRKDTDRIKQLETQSFLTKRKEETMNRSCLYNCLKCLFV